MSEIFKSKEIFPNWIQSLKMQTKNKYNFSMNVILCSLGIAINLWKKVKKYTWILEIYVY